MWGKEFRWQIVSTSSPLLLVASSRPSDVAFVEVTDTRGREAPSHITTFSHSPSPLPHLPAPRSVSRIQAASQTYNLELTLDVNTEVYPMMVRRPQLLFLASPPWRGPHTHTHTASASSRTSSTRPAAHACVLSHAVRPRACDPSQCPRARAPHLQQPPRSRQVALPPAWSFHEHPPRPPAPHSGRNHSPTVSISLEMHVRAAPPLGFTSSSPLSPRLFHGE